MQRRIIAVAALASVAAAGPIGVAQGASSKAKVMQGVVFGGVTTVTGADGKTLPSYPVVVKVNAAGTRLVRATIGLTLKCQAPPNLDIPDDVVPAKGQVIAIKGGKFSAEQPVTRIPADTAQGIPALDVSAKVTGRLNAKHTRITGTWSRKIVIYDLADPTTTAVADTCDSGVLRYTADN